MEKIYNTKTVKAFERLNEKEKLKYILGGYKHCSTFFGCNTKCSTLNQSDEEIKLVLELMNKYNLSVKDFLELYVTYWQQSFQPYKKEYGPFLTDLEKEFLKFRATNNDSLCNTRYSRIGSFAHNDKLGEKALVRLIKSSDCNNVEQFKNKYNLTDLDFIVLSKTALHDAFRFQRIVGHSDNFVPDLKKSLEDELGTQKIKKIQSHIRIKK